jgi:hypothetical protein
VPADVAPEDFQLVFGHDNAPDPSCGNRQAGGASALHRYRANLHRGSQGSRFAPMG